jgi:hypothetical protein
VLDIINKASIEKHNTTQHNTTLFRANERSGIEMSLRDNKQQTLYTCKSGDAEVRQTYETTVGIHMKILPPT